MLAAVDRHPPGHPIQDDFLVREEIMTTSNHGTSTETNNAPRDFLRISICEGGQRTVAQRLEAIRPSDLAANVIFDGGGNPCQTTIVGHVEDGHTVVDFNSKPDDNRAKAELSAQLGAPLRPGR